MKKTRRSKIGRELSKLFKRIERFIGKTDWKRISYKTFSFLFLLASLGVFGNEAQAAAYVVQGIL